MNILFNKVIHSRLFNFQPVEFAEESGYHVDVKDEENTQWEFRIFRNGDQWQIEAEKLPAWIKEIELDIFKTIDDHE
ncbi:MAG: hypothetical protein ABI416_14210 [Ginsengibacter sp.]